MGDKTNDQAEKTADEKAFEELVENAEAGVAQVMAVYEKAEARYFAAVSQIDAPLANAAYATHT